MKKSIIKEIIKEEIVKILKEEKEGGGVEKLKEKFTTLGKGTLSGVDDEEADIILSILNKLLSAAKKDQKEKLKNINKYAGKAKDEEGDKKKEEKPEEKDDKKDDKEDK